MSAEAAEAEIAENAAAIEQRSNWGWLGLLGLLRLQRYADDIQIVIRLKLGYESEFEYERSQK